MSVNTAARSESGVKLWAHSGDSHFLEPPDMFEQMLPPELAKRMPRSIRTATEEGTSETIVVDGRTSDPRIVPTPAQVPDMSAGGTISGVVRGEKVENLGLLDVSHRPPGSHDMQLRLKDLDGEGIWGEVIYPSLLMFNFMITDPELARAAFRAENEWKLENLQKVAPDRMVVTAAIPYQNLDLAIAELYHCAEIGYHAAFIPLGAPEGAKDWNYPDWDPLWSAFEETGLVPAGHLGTGGGMQTYGGPGRTVLNYAETTYAPQRFASKLVSSGVFERHPKLKVLLAESGAGWVPSLGDRLNEGYRQHDIFNKTKLAELPKETLFRHVYCSFQHDVTGVEAVEKQGYMNVLWGSDYPHLEGTFGHTQETLHGLLDNSEPWVRERVLHGTFRELFPHVSDPPWATDSSS